MEKHLHKLFADIEDSHWWSVSVRKIQIAFVQRFISKKKSKIIDVGCGPGGTLKELSLLGNAVGIDISEYALSLARKKGIKNVLKGTMTEIPFKNNYFDILTAFDVIEHVENDHDGLIEVKRVLKRGGVIILTTPAYMFLFDDHDRMNHHYRRYTKRELIQKLEKAGFSIGYISYFNTFLFPAIFGVKMLNKLLKRKGKFNNQETREPINSILRTIFSSELFFLRKMSFPFGLSLLCVATKTK